MPVSLYVGTTGAGKTFLATEHVVTLSRRISRPIFLLDMEGVTRLDGVETVSTLEEALSLFFGEGRSVRWVPEDEEDASALARGIATYQKLDPERREAILFIEEGVHCTRFDKITDDIRRLFRMHRHLRLHVFVTTQYVGDFSPLVLQCADDVFAFNSPSKRAQDRLAAEYGLVGLESLAVGEKREWHKGMAPHQEAPKPEPDPPPADETSPDT